MMARVSTLRSFCLLSLFLSFVGGFLWGNSVFAQPAAASLSERVTKLVRDAKLGNKVGISIEALDGSKVYGLRPEELRNPASNMKLVTAAAALSSLGPSFTMRTGLYGRIHNGRISTLVIKGYADPALSFGDFLVFAEDLADRGVTAIDRVVVDGSYFDSQVLPPAFDQQPNEVAAFRSAIGAVAVDRASYVLRVIPGAVGAAAKVRVGAPGYFEIKNAITSSDGGAPRVIADQITRDDGRMLLRLRGSLPAGILGVGYRRRVDRPLLHAGHRLAHALRLHGIKGKKHVSLGTKKDLPLLTSHVSPPVSQLLHRVGKHSDNFVAEMLLKVMGAEKRRPGTSQAGTEVQQALLQAAGVSKGAVTTVNGSGLFDGNKIAPQHLVKVLRHMYRDPALRTEYVAQLSVGGEDGTLRNRLRHLPTKRMVRAKTGTLAAVIALSGYVIGKDDAHTYLFSFLANGVRGKQGKARRLADAIATEIAREAH